MIRTKKIICRILSSDLLYLVITRRMIINSGKSKFNLKRVIFHEGICVYFSRTSTKSINQVRESVNDAHPKYQAVALNEGARIRIVNCSNDSNKHSSVTRPTSNANGSKKLNNNSIDKLD